MWAENATVHAATRTGPTMREDVPWRIVLHTTEGPTAESAIAAYTATGSWPHFTAEYGTGRVFQHYDTTAGARALRHPAGTVDTNAARAIQIELVGYAGTITDAALAWLAETLIWPVADHHRIVLETPIFRGVHDAYGLKSATRMTDNEWLAFGGICGHQHVPHNDHWDPGAINTTPITNRSTAMATLPAWARPSWDKAVDTGNARAGTEFDDVPKYVLITLLDRLGLYDVDLPGLVDRLAALEATAPTAAVPVDDLTADIVAAVLTEIRDRLT